MIATARQVRGAEIPRWFPWLYLVLIIAAEVITSFVGPQFGLVFHASLLVGFMLHVGIGRPGPDRNLVLALTLAPLIRLLSLTMPLGKLPELAWYPIIAIPLTAASWQIIRLVQVSRRDLGLCWGRLTRQFAIAGCGLVIGALEYTILTPQPLAAISSWVTFASAALVLMLSTGFVEELIFRGLLLSMALSAMKRWALIYVSLLFAALHIGHRSPSNLLLVFTVGMFFAVVAHRSGSILGVALAHGLANVTLFLVMPFLALRVPTDAVALGPNVVWEKTLNKPTTLSPFPAPTPSSASFTPTSVPADRPAEGTGSDAFAARPSVPTAVAPTVEPGPTATPVPEVPCASAPEIASTYIVRSGDTLWDIAGKLYGDPSRFPLIYDANRDRIDEMDHIHPGLELRIPSASSTTSAPSTPEPPLASCSGG